MPVIILRKNATQPAQSAVLVDEQKRLLIFPDKNAAKRYLAGRGIYGLVGYEFKELDIQPAAEPFVQTEPETQEEGHAAQEPAA